jgi:uncharacterized protein (DUF1697 family)
MSTWILLLRGINVGGKNRLPMADLVADLEALGLENVKTYIQSGNVVFQASSDAVLDVEALQDDVAGRIERRHGFRPQVVVLGAGALEQAAAANPFPEAEAEPRSLHLFFLASAADAPDLEGLEAVKASSERFELADGVFYLHAPDGIGRSRLAAKVEKSLGVTVTARNWRTVRKLLEMAGSA